jgi:hypothetical protein
MSGCSSSPSSTSIPSRIGAGGSIVSEEGTLTLRYSDGNGRPLMARPPIPTVLWAQQQGPIREEDSDGLSSCNPYSTLPFQRKMRESQVPHQTVGPPPPLPAMPKSKSHRFSGCTFGHSLPPPLSPDTVPSQALTSGNVHRVSADLHYQTDERRTDNFHGSNNETCNYYDVNTSNGGSDQNSGQSAAELLLPAATFSSSDHLVSPRTSQI